MLKNNNIIQKFFEPYLMAIKIISWEFLLFFSLFTLFLNTTLSYLVEIISDKYLKPQIILSDQILWPFVIITLIFILLSIIFYKGVIKNKNKLKIIVIILILLIQSLILTAYINKRLYSENTSWLPHDGIAQTEVAMNYLIQGKNPYHENYYKTELDNARDHFIMFISVNKIWEITNPALENYVYMPLSFILPLPLKYLFTNIFNFYDNRIFNFIFYILACLLVYKIPEDPKKKIGLLVFFSLNDFSIPDIIYGFNDIVPMYFLLLAYYFLKKSHYTKSIIILSLAGLIKQNIIFFWPFFLFYIFINQKYQFKIKSLLKFSKYPLIILLLICLFLLPFILWCPNCFYHDTIYYLGHIYPARGIGLAGLLLQLGIITDPFQFYNFALWQILFILIFLPLFLYRQYKNNTPKNAYLHGTLLMGGVWFLARYFTDSHFYVVITNLLIYLFL